MLETEKLETILNRQLAWIVAADSRLSLLLPLSTAMLGALAAYAPRPSDWNLSCGIPAAFAIFFLCLSIAFCALAFFPRTSGTKGSIIFFEGINSRNLDQYQDYLASCRTEDYNSDLVQQCYINATIASIKFTWIKRGMASLFVSALPWALTIYQFYGLRHAHV
jgi:hypothetical protein